MGLRFKIPLGAQWVGWIVFIGAIFTWFLWVDVSLWVHHNQPVYYHRSFVDLFSFPGHPVRSLAAMVMQGISGCWDGAVLMSLLMVAWGGAIFFIFRELRVKPWFSYLVVVSVVPIVSAHGKYHYAAELTFQYLFAAWFTALCLFFVRRWHGRCFGLIILVFSLLVYSFAGHPGLFLFVVLLSVWLVASHHIQRLVWMVLPLLLPYMITHLLPHLTIYEAYWGNYMVCVIDSFVDVPWSIKLYPLFLLVLVAVLLGFNTQERLKPIVELLVFVMLFVLVGWFSRSPKQKLSVRIDKLAYEKRWDELLKVVDQFGDVRSRDVQFQVNRALYHKGLLLEGLFYYPQYYGAGGLFLENETKGDIAMSASDLYFDMSFVSAARHWANEAFTDYGPRPRIVRRLIECYKLEGEPALVKKYESLLRLSPFSLLDDSPTYEQAQVGERSVLSSRNEVLRFHQFENQFVATNHPLTNLYYVVNSEPDHRMGVEYLVACHLLSGNLEELVKQLGRLKAVGYSRLPEAVQEAVLVYRQMNPGGAVDLCGFVVEKKVVERFKAFNALAAGGFRKDVASMKRFNGYKGGYLFYLTFYKPK
ncbi:hypothetical protein LX69_01557 [Breznakibacter xylanolyticus]|uniref:Uncharacterized protein n=1 Tax=Breznakibacter xylanolyticus TaxID=990 RepID=A0A2W7P1B5_9BACT|nr:DUF6057 family protein [Breznakibacter xylanolyticus]PZX17242.1 hypothetical protein LX69_01557 [Breznakibacter xylanolyticus]